MWYIYNNITEVDGYKNPNKVLVTYSDLNNDGIPDNPELFELIVNPLVNSNKKYVYFQKTSGYNNFVIKVIEQMYEFTRISRLYPPQDCPNRLFWQKCPPPAYHLHTPRRTMNPGLNESVYQGRGSL
mgnify:CR=1 FL=1